MVLVSHQRLNVHRHRLTSGVVPRRIDTLRQEVEDLERREREGQSKYRELETQQHDIATSINDLEDELAMQEAEALNDAALAAEA